MKKLSNILLLGTLFLTTVFSSNVTSVNAQAEVLEEGQQPLNVIINSVKFDELRNQLVLKVDVTNNSSDFISGLVSTLAVYKGEALLEEGYLFADLELTYTTGGKIQDLSPKEHVVLNVAYDLPSNLETGNYFVQFAMTDREIEYHGVNYYDQPVAITGTGGFVGDLTGFVRSDGEEQTLFGGRLLKADQEISVVVPLSDNSKLQKILDEETLYAKVSVRSISTGDILKEFPIEEIVVKNGEIEYTLTPWEGMPMGSMTIIMKILDGNDTPVANDLMARWFRADRVGRIAKIETQTNYYKKGENLDLNVYGSFFKFDEGDKLLIQVEITADEEVFQFEKEYNFMASNPEEMTFDFSDQVIPSSVKVQSIKASIKDMKTGEVIDSFTRELTQKDIYIGGLKKVASLWEMIIVTLVMLILIALGLFLRKKVPTAMLILLMVLGVAGGILFSGEIANAVVCPAPASICGPAFTSNTVWATFNTPLPAGNLGMCSQNIKVTGVYVHMSCDSCLNGVVGNVGLEVQKADGTAVGSVCKYVADPNHVYSWKPVGDPLRYIPAGPFTLSYPLTKPGNHRYRIVLNTAEGCKCFGDSWTNAWKTTSCALPVPKCATSFSPTNVTLPAKPNWTISSTLSVTNTAITCTGANPYTKNHTTAVNGTWPYVTGSPLVPGLTTCNITVTSPGGTGSCSASFSATTASTDDPVCGDGEMISPETCDDGNIISGDGCSNTCVLESGCVGSGCSSGCVNGGCSGGGGGGCEVGNCALGCPENCVAGCGSDFVCGPGENTINCPRDCSSSVCGNSVKESGEDCDDGNSNNGDSCANNCTFGPEYIGGEARCGDNNCDLGENFLTCPSDCSAEIIEF